MRQRPEERSLERLEFISRDFIHIFLFYQPGPLTKKCFVNPYARGGTDAWMALHAEIGYTSAMMPSPPPRIFMAPLALEHLLEQGNRGPSEHLAIVLPFGGCCPVLGGEGAITLFFGNASEQVHHMRKTKAFDQIAQRPQGFSLFRAATCHRCHSRAAARSVADRSLGHINILILCFEHVNLLTEVTPGSESPSRTARRIAAIPRWRNAVSGAPMAHHTHAFDGATMLKEPCTIDQLRGANVAAFSRTHKKARGT
jgi:hypothetical protein